MTNTRLDGCGAEREVWKLRSKTRGILEVLRLRPCFPAPLRMTGFFGARATCGAALGYQLSDVGLRKSAGKFITPLL